MRLLPLMREDNQKLLSIGYEFCKNVELQAYRTGPKIKFSDFIVPDSVKKGLISKKVNYRLLKKIDSQICDYRLYSKKNRLIDEDVRRSEILESIKLKRKIK